MTFTMARKKTMSTTLVAVLAVGAASLCVSNACAQTTTPPKPVRVRAKMDGFDLTPKGTAARATQVGGASRSIGGLTLYAPTMGKAYSLTPTFYWSTDDPQAEFTFRITQPSSGSGDPIYETKVVGGHFIYPADAPALAPGGTYVWTVSPTLDMLGKPASASFLIVGGNERETVAAALATAQTATDPAAATAKVFTDMRLWFDALAAYSALIDKFPTRAEFYQARADLYDQLPSTAALADADAAKAHK